MSAIPHLDHTEIAESLSLFSRFATAIDRPELLDKIRPPAQRYNTGLYRLVLVGEEKRGKSSLVNALLGEPSLLPAGPAPMTACVFKIVYGPSMQHRIYFLPKNPEDPEGSRPEPLDIAPEDVAAYGSEDGNPDNVKGVDFIAVEFPHPLLKAGLVIVDLPGLGGLKHRHGMLAMSYLPNADAAFFVVDSVASALTREEIATLDSLREFTNHIVFVHTKIDAVSKLQWQSWRDQNLEEIEHRLGIQPSDIRYFPVSSKLKSRYDRMGEVKDLDDSGFSPLLHLLENDLVPRKHDRLAMPMLAALIQQVADAAGPIENEVKILASSSKDGLDRIEAELRQGQETYERWKNDDLPKIMTCFREDFRSAEIDTERYIARDLDPSSYGPIVGPVMEQVEGWNNVSADQIADQSSEINDSVVGLCGKRLNEISSSFEERTNSAYQRASAEIGTAARQLVVDHGGYVVDLPLSCVTPRSRSSLWNLAMQARMGMATGSMVTSAVVVAANVLFPPLALAAGAIGVFVSIVGIRRSIQEARKREREQVEQKLRSLLMDTVRRLQSHAIREFHVAAEQSKNAMLTSLNDAVQTRSRDHKSAMSAIVGKRQRTRDENAKRQKELTDHLIMAAAILKSLSKAGLPLDVELRSAA
jgi:GTP-binding protein EngB required for normal cell division